MKSNSLEILEALLNQLKIDLIELNDKINSVNRSINECDQYIRKMSSTDIDEYRFFSPRTESNHYIKEIEQKREEKKKWKEELEYLYAQKTNITEKISQLEQVMIIEKYHEDILSLEESDKKRAAILLHDKSISKLFFINDQLHNSSMDIMQAPMKVRDEIDSIRKEITETIDDINDIVFDLYPSAFGHISIKEVFEKKLSGMKERQGYEVDQYMEDVSCETISTVISIYHIIQECLLNIEKHSKAKRILLHTKNHLNLYLIDIKDDGVGFQVDEKLFGAGLNMMKSRITLLNGTYKINSISECGTSIHIEIPLN